MPTTAILFGRILIFIGIAGYAYGWFTGGGSLTAMIPALFGIVLEVLGYVSKIKENLRKHLMHVAVIVGLIGFLATVSSFLKLPSLFSGTAERPAAIVSQVATSLVCLIFVVLCVKSFIAARTAK